MEKSSFFNSINGDRKYKAEDFAAFFNSLLTNGVFPNPSSNLQVIANNNMTVTVKMGKAWINGYVYINTDDLILNIDVADGVLKRIDRVVIQYSTANREIKAKVKKGTFANSPVAPTLQRDADIYELGIADIFIANGATSITQANITDLRLNTSLCGIVNSLIQADTTTLFNQYQSWLNSKQSEFNTWFTDTQNTTQTNLDNMEADFNNDFNTWFNGVKNQLGSDVAGNLLNLITDNANNIGDLSTLKTESKDKIVNAINENTDKMGILNEQIDSNNIDISNIQTEITDARKGETTLKAKMDKVDTSLAERKKLISAKFHFPNLEGDNSTSMDCSVVINKDIVTVIDLGHNSNKTYIVNYLKSLGITKIDNIIITHYHGDHTGSSASGGLLTLLNSNFNLSNCKVYLPYTPNFTTLGIQSVQDNYNWLNTEITACGLTKVFPTEDMEILIGDFTVKFMNCSEAILSDYYNVLYQGKADYNNFSMVAAWKYNDDIVLFGSDIQPASQEKLRTKLSKVRLYKTHHHSNDYNGWNAEYMNTIFPDYAVTLSCSGNEDNYGNSFSTRFFYENGIPQYMPHKFGDLTVEYDGIEFRFSKGSFAYKPHRKWQYFNSLNALVRDYNFTTVTYEDIFNALPLFGELRFIPELTAVNLLPPELAAAWGGLVECYKESNTSMHIKVTSKYAKNQNVYYREYSTNNIADLGGALTDWFINNMPRKIFDNSANPLASGATVNSDINVSQYKMLYIRFATAATIIPVPVIADVTPNLRGSGIYGQADRLATYNFVGTFSGKTITLGNSYYIEIIKGTPPVMNISAGTIAAIYAI